MIPKTDLIKKKTIPNYYSIFFSSENFDKKRKIRIPIFIFKKNLRSSPTKLKGLGVSTPKIYVL